jgi:hypothetical protein
MTKSQVRLQLLRKAKPCVAYMLLIAFAFLGTGRAFSVYVYTTQDTPALEKLTSCKNYEEIASGQWGTSIHIYNWLQSSKLRTFEHDHADFLFVPAHGKCVPTPELNQTFFNVITQLPYLKYGIQTTHSLTRVGPTCLHAALLAWPREVGSIGKRTRMGMSMCVTSFKRKSAAWCNECAASSVPASCTLSHRTLIELSLTAATGGAGITSSYFHLAVERQCLLNGNATFQKLSF